MCSKFTQADARRKCARRGIPGADIGAAYYEIRRPPAPPHWRRVRRRNLALGSARSPRVNAEVSGPRIPWSGVSGGWVSGGTRIRGDGMSVPTVKLILIGEATFLMQDPCKFLNQGTTTRSMSFQQLSEGALSWR